MPKRKRDLRKIETRIEWRQRAVQMMALGVKASIVAKKVRRSLSTIYRLNKRYKDTKSVLDKKGRGRPKKVTEAITRRVKRLLKDRAVGSIRRVRAELEKEGTKLSRSTVHNITKRIDIRCVHPQPRPDLTDDHKAYRVTFCNERLEEDPSEWQTYVFSDEKLFIIGEYGRVVWINKGDPIPHIPTST